MNIKEMNKFIFERFNEISELESKHDKYRYAWFCPDYYCVYESTLEFLEYDNVAGATRSIDLKYFEEENWKELYIKEVIECQWNVSFGNKIGGLNGILGRKIWRLIILL